jgi:hypothetical protein
MSSAVFPFLRAIGNMLPPSPSLVAVALTPKRRTSLCSSNVLSTDMKTIFLNELWRPTAREENGMPGL